MVVPAAVDISCVVVTVGCCVVISMPAVEAITGKVAVSSVVVVVVDIAEVDFPSIMTDVEVFCRTASVVAPGVAEFTGAMLRAGCSVSTSGYAIVVGSELVESS
jgi:hypothetical protein